MILVLFSAVDNCWKIADFGLTSRGSSQSLITTSKSRGKDCYRAPELLREPDSVYNTKTDIWSIGCIIFELCTGGKLFIGDWQVMGYSKGSEQRCFTLPFVYEPARKDLIAIIQNSIRINALMRPSANNLIHALTELNDRIQTPLQRRDSVLTIAASDAIYFPTHESEW